MQILHIDQMRTKRDEKRQAAEQTRREEQDARILQRQTEQDQTDGTDHGRDVRTYGPSSTSWGRAASWTQPIAPKDQWPLFLRRSLSGAGLTAVAAMTAARQADYDAVKDKLLSEYYISTETFRKQVFDTPFDSAHPDGWLSHHRQNFQQWIASSPLGVEATVLMEITLKRLPKWLEAQIRNLNPRSYDEMAEAIVRHLDNQKPNGKERSRQETPFHPIPVERGPRK